MIKVIRMLRVIRMIRVIRLIRVIRRVLTAKPWSIKKAAISFFVELPHCRSR